MSAAYVASAWDTDEPPEPVCGDFPGCHADPPTCGHVEECSPRDGYCVMDDPDECDDNCRFYWVEQEADAMRKRAKGE